MNMQGQIELFERVLAQREKEWQQHFGGRSSPTGQLAYLNDIVPYKNIVKMLYIKDGRLVCWGPVDCLNTPATKCANGHETCKPHENDCVQCQIEKGISQGSHLANS